MRLPSILIVLSCWLMGSTSVLANSLENIRVSSESNDTRIIMDLAQEPKFTYFTITESKPVRLVIDLKNTDVMMDLPLQITDSAVLDKIRTSRPPTEDEFRVVFELKKELVPELFTLPPAGDFGYRLVVELPNDEDDTKPIANTATESSVTEVLTEIENNITRTALPFGNDDIIIAIDPGHGGIDPGAVGPMRKYEKHITLAIAKQMAEFINSVEGMKAVLTRNGDYYVDLNKRSDIAREYGAHFLISLHADGFHQPEPRGASVWVLSKNRANSEIGRWIERHEKQSELLGGGSVLQEYQDENLSRALLDLQFSNSHKEGYNVAVQVLRELGKVTHLHKSSPEYASLAVLKAPDIPSILVEAGFITNPQEEKLLLTASYQEKIAKAVYEGVKGYFEQFPPDGTLFAAMKNGVKHKVVYGESLSVIAEKYGISVDRLKKNNNLTSDVLQLNQELIIFNAIKANATSQLLQQSTQHVVRNGEYLGKIAGNYGVTINQIRDINLLNSDVLEIGQILIIPGK